MARTISYVFGAVLTLVGVIGFFMNPVLGIFAANTLHSLVHIATGLVLLGIALWASEQTSVALKIFGVVYGILAIVGFVMGGDMLLGIIDNSLADQMLHLVLGVVFLWAGFMNGKSPTMPDSNMNGNMH